MKTILIIDDDTEFCSMLRDYLAHHGIHLEMQHDGATGLGALHAREYDLVLLDVMLPGIDGLAVLSRIKATRSVGVFLLSALGSDEARITGLDQGADDYLAKPFNPRELLARINAILRRSEPSHASAETQAVEAAPALALDRGSREAYYRGRRLPLTDVEFSLLSVFVESPGTVLAREDLVSRVFQRSFDPMDRSLDVHICRLRRKLDIVGESDNPIKTIRSSGYLFSQEVML